MSATYGEIPESIIRAKNEVTRMYTDPEDMTNYFRSTLRDVSADKPRMASDAPRDNSTYANEFLSIRHEGHRSGEVPWRPDEFLELTERDPRGIQNDPILSQTRRHTFARKHLYKFTPDGDATIQEAEVPSFMVHRKLRDGMYLVKDRLKIFSTSKDYVMSGKNFRYGDTSSISLTDTQLPLSAALEAIGEPRNATTFISNAMPIGWNTTTDNEFSVAQYGLSRAQQVQQDNYNTAMNVIATQQINENFRNQVTAISMARNMASASKERLTRNQHVDNRFETSATSKNRFAVNHADQRATKNETFADLPEQQQIKDNIARYYKRSMNTHGQPGFQVFDQKIVESMMTIAHTTQKDPANTLKRNAISDSIIEQPFMDNNIRYTQSKHLSEYYNNRLNNYTTTEFRDGMTVAPLGALIKANPDKFKHINIGDGQYTTSTERFNDRTQRGPDVMSFHETKETQGHDTFDTIDRTVAPMNSKNIRHLQQDDTEYNDVNDR